MIATRDSPSLIDTRVANIRATTRDVDSVEIIVAVDRGASVQRSEYQRSLPDDVRVVDGDAPGGTSATLNAGVRAATGALIVFADSAQMFDPGAVRALIECFRDAAVGAVSGYLRMRGHAGKAALSAFWYYERWLRRAESAADSIVGVTGAIYAIRASLWRELPAGVILDDVYVPLTIVQQGFRVVYCERATAVDYRSFTAVQEFTRRARTLTGILQLCAVLPSVLNPRRNRIWAQFVCHKLLRIATPYLALLALLSACVAFLSISDTILVLFAACALPVTVALVFPQTSMPGKAARQLGWGLLILCAPFVACANALRGNWDVWHPQDPGRRGSDD